MWCGVVGEGRRRGKRCVCEYVGVGVGGVGVGGWGGPGTDEYPKRAA